jgi:hypothetical protein
MVPTGESRVETHKYPCPLLTVFSSSVITTVQRCPSDFTSQQVMNLTDMETVDWSQADWIKKTMDKTKIETDLDHETIGMKDSKDRETQVGSPPLFRRIHYPKSHLNDFPPFESTHVLLLVCRCNDRLKSTTEGSTRLVYTGFLGGLEHPKIETRLIDQRFASVMGGMFLLFIINRQIEI